jgi:hypothetical protein
MGGACGAYGGIEVCTGCWWGRPKGKRPVVRAGRRGEGIIKMDLQEVGGGRGDWMELAQNMDRWRALVGTVRNFRVP